LISHFPCSSIRTGITRDPGKPTDNAFIDAFNSKFRSECLNAHWFMSLDDARRKMEAWRRYYNEERPHSGIGQMVPILLHNVGGASSSSQAKEAENSGLG
jgi:putative transposase